MLNLIFADILSIIIELVEGSIMNIIGFDVASTMAIAAIITNIPILMIYFSRILPNKTNRMVNIIAAVVTIVFVIGGGNYYAHYLIIASIEVIVLMAIIYHSVYWK